MRRFQAPLQRFIALAFIAPTFSVASAWAKPDFCREVFSRIESPAQPSQKPPFILEPFLKDIGADGRLDTLGSSLTLGDLPEIASIYSSLRVLDNERGLKTWKRLDENERNFIGEMARSPGGDRTINLYREALRLSREPLSSLETLERHLSTLLDMLLASSSHPGKIGREITHPLFDLLKKMEGGDPKDRPIQVAAWMGVELAAQKFPLDASFAIFDYILLRYDLPVPMPVGVAKNDMYAQRANTSLVSRALESEQKFASYLQEGIKESIRTGLMRQALDRDFVKSSLPPKLLNGLGDQLGEGGNGVAHLHQDAKGAVTVVKLAKSMSALAQMRREAEFMRLSQTFRPELRKHFVRLISSDPQGFWMQKEFIAGPNGRQILASSGSLSERQRSELRSLQVIAQQLARDYGFVLDLKPGNVVWVGTGDAGTWVMIDLGPKFLPISELNDFETYLNTYWVPPRS